MQFVAITPKPKNSPMTEHQREMAKATRYIPALYQDLSQSHSQSQSQSESVSILSGNKYVIRMYHVVILETEIRKRRF